LFAPHDLPVNLPELTQRGLGTDKYPPHAPPFRAPNRSAPVRLSGKAKGSLPMFAHMEIGRIAGIPIYLDMMFVLVLLLFTSPYFTGGSTEAMSAGFVIVVGLLISILLHELGHALMGRPFNAHVSHIELTALGGLAHFERSLPRSVFARTLIYLAGPAVNVGLWLGFGALARQAYGNGLWMLGLPLGELAVANLVLAIFNLMPAYPLDGGWTLDAWLGRVLGPVWSVRIVAGLGLLIAAGVAYLAFPHSFFLLFVALFLALWNWQKLQSVGGWQR
jgi:Zn-dependent protease